MPEFEVEYEYFIPEFGVTRVRAENVAEAEDVALEQLSDTLDPEVKGVSIESVREIRE